MFDYETIPLHWVNRLGFLVRKDLGQAFAANGFQVSPEEWAILLVLWKKGPQLPSHLADMTLRDRTTITRLIDKMEQKQLVTRKADATDGRRSKITTSAKGAALQAQLVPIAGKIIAKSTQHISAEDMQITLRTLQAMTQNLMAK